jgi:23S rRNA (pseudouridine1915-N3)-methyltransferase
MAKLRFVWVGKTQRGFVQEGVDHYARRIRAFLPVEIVETRQAAHSGRDAAQALRVEAEALLRRIGERETLIVLDAAGEQLTSPRLAQRLDALRNRGTGTLTFTVGGAYGLDDSVKQRAQWFLSLSPLTFPHQLVRLILMEQVYRALTIQAGLPYHHGE